MYDAQLPITYHAAETYKVAFIDIDINEFIPMISVYLRCSDPSYGLPVVIVYIYIDPTAGVLFNTSTISASHYITKNAQEFFEDQVENIMKDIQKGLKSDKEKRFSAFGGKRYPL